MIRYNNGVAHNYYPEEPETSGLKIVARIEAILDTKKNGHGLAVCAARDMDYQEWAEHYNMNPNRLLCNAEKLLVSDIPEVLNGSASEELKKIAAYVSAKRAPAGYDDKQKEYIVDELNRQLEDSRNRCYKILEMQQKIPNDPALSWLLDTERKAVLCALYEAAAGESVLAELGRMDDNYGLYSDAIRCAINNPEYDITPHDRHALTDRLERQYIETLAKADKAWVLDRTLQEQGIDIRRAAINRISDLLVELKELDKDVLDILGRMPGVNVSGREDYPIVTCDAKPSDSIIRAYMPLYADTQLVDLPDAKQEGGNTSHSAESLLPEDKTAGWARIDIDADDWQSIPINMRLLIKEHGKRPPECLVALYANALNTALNMRSAIGQADYEGTLPRLEEIESLPSDNTKCYDAKRFGMINEPPIIF